MQVLLCQRAVSLIAVRAPTQVGGRKPAVAEAASSRGQRGFTLIELMITLTIAVVLLMIAVPSFKNLTLSNRLTTAANDIVASIHSARMEAIKRNSNTQFCSNTTGNNTTSDALGKACTTQAGAVYAMSGTAASPVLASTPGMNAPLQFNGNVTAVRFNGQGLGQKPGTAGPYTGTVADICTSQTNTSNHRLITMTAGSILKTSISSGACPSS